MYVVKEQLDLHAFIRNR